MELKTTPFVADPPDNITINGTDYVRKASSTPLGKRILLQSADIAAIANTVGGRNLATAQDIVKLFQDNFRIMVGGAIIDLDPEDAQALKDQHAGTTFMTLEEYTTDIIKDALHMFLWGSSRGVTAYK